MIIWFIKTLVFRYFVIINLKKELIFYFCCKIIKNFVILNYLISKYKDKNLSVVIKTIHIKQIKFLFKTWVILIQLNIPFCWKLLNDIPNISLEHSPPPLNISQNIPLLDLTATLLQLHPFIISALPFTHRPKNGAFS